MISALSLLRPDFSPICEADRKVHKWSLPPLTPLPLRSVSVQLAHVPEITFTLNFSQIKFSIYYPCMPGARVAFESICAFRWDFWTGLAFVPPSHLGQIPSEKQHSPSTRNPLSVRYYSSMLRYCQLADDCPTDLARCTVCGVSSHTLPSSTTLLYGVHWTPVPLRHPDRCPPLVYVLNKSLTGAVGSPIRWLYFQHAVLEPSLCQPDAISTVLPASQQLPPECGQLYNEP